MEHGIKAGKKRAYKYAALAVLLAGVFFLLFYSHVILHTSIIFTHTFYLPIILAALWWQRKGIVLAVGLGILLILSSAIFLESDLINNFSRAGMFVIVSVFVSHLSTQIAGKEKALQDARRRLMDIVEFLPDATFVIDSNGKVIAWNRAIETMTGIQKDEIIGNGDRAYSVPFYGEQGPMLVDFLSDGAGEMESRYVAFERQGKTLRAEIFAPLIFGGKGAHLWATAAPLYDVNGRIGAIESLRDISERKRFEEALKASEEKMRMIIESSPIGVRISQGNQIVYANPAYVAMFGYDRADEILGLPVITFYASGVNAEPEGDDRGSTRRREAVMLKKNAEHFNASIWTTWIDYRGEPGTLEFVIDNSSEKRLREQLFHAQKMEAVGILSAGIAHEFNNLLQGIQGCAQVILLDKAKEDFGYKELEMIAEAVERGATLVRQLLTFSRKVAPCFRSVDVNHEVREAEKLLGRTLSNMNMIRIKLRLDESLKIIEADSAQLKQMLVNLAVNARDAMPEGGDLTIFTENVGPGKELSSNCSKVSADEYVRISVSDTGHGMDSQTLEHIFEPFFTTKEFGKGSGLGLSIVYGIVESHGGYIKCSSEPGCGTTFHVYLPVSRQKKRNSDETGLSEKEMSKTQPASLIL